MLSATPQKRLLIPSLSISEELISLVEQHISDPIKRAFALALLKNPSDPFEAARSPGVWPHNTGYALWTAQNWPRDPEVQCFVKAAHSQLSRDDLELPSDTEYASLLWRSAQDVIDPDTRLKYLRLYAESRGHLKRPVGGPEIDASVTVNKVMIVTDRGSDVLGLASIQQQKLQADLGKIIVDMEDDEDTA